MIAAHEVAMPGLDSPTRPVATGSPLARIITGRFAPTLPTPVAILPILRAVADRGPAATTRATVAAILDQLLVAFCNARLADLDEDRARPLARLDEAAILAYLATLAHLTPSTINGRLAVLRAVCTRLVRAGLLPSDPLADIRCRRVSDRSRTPWLDAPQARALLAACAGTRPLDRRDRAILATMLYGGLRVSECARMAVEDLADVGGHAVLHLVGKGGRQERIKVRPEVTQAIAAWCRSAHIASGPLWRPLARCGRRLVGPGPLTTRAITELLARRARRADLGHLHLRPHSLRHTFVTLALKGGAPLQLVQVAARHRNPATTIRYAHDLDSLDDNAVDYISL